MSAAFGADGIVAADLVMSFLDVMVFGNVEMAPADPVMSILAVGTDVCLLIPFLIVCPMVFGATAAYHLLMSFLALELVLFAFVGTDYADLLMVVSTVVLVAFDPADSTEAVFDLVRGA